MRWKFALLILLQVVLLAGIIGYRQYWIESNERILLESLPVDPRDIFRGDYVTLSYDLSNIDLDKLGVNETFKRNDTIYATLKKTESGTYKLDSVSKFVPKKGKFIQGRVTSINANNVRKTITVLQTDGSLRHFEQPWTAFKVDDNVLLCLGPDDTVRSSCKTGDYCKCPDGVQTATGIVQDIKEITFRQVHAEYGIEHYFVEEGKGRVIERARNARDLKVEVALRRDGKGLITALYLNGKRME